MELISAYRFLGAIGFIIVLFGGVVVAIVAIVFGRATLASMEVLADFALHDFFLPLEMFVPIAVRAIIITVATPFAIPTTLFILGFVFVFILFIVIVTI